MGKSLYEVKQKRANRKNKNTITDADYFLREKTPEDITKNTINMTPTIDTSVEAKATAPKAKATAPKATE